PARRQSAQERREHEHHEQDECGNCASGRHALKPLTTESSNIQDIYHSWVLSDVPRSKRIAEYRVAKSRVASSRKVSLAPRRLPKRSPRPAETLTEQAYRVIEEQIVTLRLKPGEFLSEQMLSATYKFGRTPIREALQRLAREGLIAIFPRKGMLVSDLNP